MLTRVALMLVLAGAPLAAQGAPADTGRLPSVTLPSALDRVLRDYERGWTAGDEDALAALFTEDGFVLQGGRAPVRGREGIRRAYATNPGSPLHLRALAYAAEDSIGYIIGAYGAAAADGDAGKFVLTLRRGADGRWLIFSDMDNSSRSPRRPQAAPPPPNGP